MGLHIRPSMAPSLSIFKRVLAKVFSPPPGIALCRIERASMQLTHFMLLLKGHLSVTHIYIYVRTGQRGSKAYDWRE